MPGARDRRTDNRLVAGASRRGAVDPEGLRKSHRRAHPSDGFPDDHSSHLSMKNTKKESRQATPRKKTPKALKSKKEPKAAQQSLEERVLEALRAARFGPDGLREIKKPLNRDEYDFSCFSCLKPEEASYVVNYEYHREIRVFHDLIRQLRGIDQDMTESLPKFGSKMFAAYSFVGLLDNVSAFPLPIVTIRRNDESEGRVFEISTSTKPINGFNETSPLQFLELRLRGESEYFSTHCIVIQRNCNRKIIKSDFSKWLIKSEKERVLPGRDGRPEATVMDDRLNQLAAYRAHRAGISFNEFLALKPRLSYSDESAFIKGYKKAEEALLSLMH